MHCVRQQLRQLLTNTAYLSNARNYIHSQSTALQINASKANAHINLRHITRFLKKIRPDRVSSAVKDINLPSTPRDVEGHVDASPVASHSPPAYSQMRPASDTQRATPKLALDADGKPIHPITERTDTTVPQNKAVVTAAESASLADSEQSSKNEAMGDHRSKKSPIESVPEPPLPSYFNYFQPATQIGSQTHPSFLPRVFKQRADATWERHTDFRNPRRIYLVRHGEAWGNVDESVFERIPDSQVPITPRGFQQARQAGRLLRSLIGTESVEFFVSPYTRALQTADAIINELSQPFVDKEGNEIGPGRSISVREDPRLREQDFGNLQRLDDITRCRREREYCGAFYYRFPEGEAGTDVYDRVADFQDFLEMAFDEKYERPPANLVIVTHGMTLRLFLMRYFRWSVSTFHKLWNPVNCKVVALERVAMTEPLVETNEGRFPYSLLTPLRQDDVDPPDADYMLKRLFSRRWADPVGGINFSELNEEQRLQIIKEQGLLWPKSNSPSPAAAAAPSSHGSKGGLLSLADDIFANPKHTFIGRARSELSSKLRMVEEEKQKWAAQNEEIQSGGKESVDVGLDIDVAKHSSPVVHHRSHKQTRLYPHSSQSSHAQQQQHHLPGEDASPVGSLHGEPVSPVISVPVSLPSVEEQKQKREEEEEEKAKGERDGKIVRHQ